MFYEASDGVRPSDEGVGPSGAARELRDLGARLAPEPEGSTQAPHLLRFLARLRELDAQATGALVVTREHLPVGTLFLERGRVCWAAAHGRARRLSDLLCEHHEPRLDHRTLEHVLAQCKTWHQPLGEALLDSGLLTEEELRAALLEHTAESLDVIAARDDVELTWVEHRRHRYDARFTFSLRELVLAGAARLPVQAQLARPVLERVLRGGGRGLAFHWARGSTLLALRGELELPEIEALVARSVDALSGLDDDEARAPRAVSEGAARALVWRIDCVAYAVGLDRHDALPLRLAALRGTLGLLAAARAKAARARRGASAPPPSEGEGAVEHPARGGS
jgi:hypothetical protein